MSEAKQDGGPAFPSVGEGFGNPTYSAPGMSLRQWYAGMAMQGLLVRYETVNACDAFRIADDMIREGQK